jgi:hypothetical protein
MAHSACPRIIWQLACWTLAAASTALADEPRMYGGIEVGSKGIKVVAVPIDENGAPDLTKKVLNLPHVGVNNVTLADRDSHGKFRADALAEAGAAVADFYRHLRGEMRIPPERIWVVASSGLTSDGVPENMDELREAIARATDGEKHLEEIDQHKEVELLIRGVVPREHWGDAILLDVGSGNAKIGYIEPAVGINVEKCQVLSTKVDGTVKFTKQVQAVMKKRGVRGFPAFRAAAQAYRQETEEKVAEDLDRSAGLKSRPRVYISGGVVWAIATLTNPDEVVSQDLYVKFSLKDLHEFHDKLCASGRPVHPDLGGLPAKVRERAEAEIRAAMDMFTPENLLAGSEIVLGFAQMLDWKDDPNKEIYFAKSGVVAWIVGYVETERKKVK